MRQRCGGALGVTPEGRRMRFCSPPSRHGPELSWICCLSSFSLPRCSCGRSCHSWTCQWFWGWPFRMACRCFWTRPMFCWWSWWFLVETRGMRARVHLRNYILRLRSSSGSCLCRTHAMSRIHVAVLTPLRICRNRRMSDFGGSGRTARPRWRPQPAATRYSPNKRETCIQPMHVTSATHEFGRFPLAELE